MKREQNKIRISSSSSVIIRMRIEMRGENNSDYLNVNIVMHSILYLGFGSDILILILRLDLSDYCPIFFYR